MFTIFYATFLKPLPCENKPLFLGNEGICNLYTEGAAWGEWIIYPLVA